MKETRNTDQTVEVGTQLNTINPPVRNLGRIQNIFIEADANLAFISEEVSHLERLQTEAARRRQEQERVRLKRQFLQD